jgi:hypothetical protein
MRLPLNHRQRSATTLSYWRGQRCAMGAAPLRYDADANVAWNELWTDFCDLALAGGPPHRGELLEPVTPEAVHADPAGYAQVVAELARGLRLVTGLSVVTQSAPGWIGLVCQSEAMALWLLRAIVVENVSVRREAATLFFPAGPSFQLAHEIKNIITVVAKTHHYWLEYQDAAALANIAERRRRAPLIPVQLLPPPPPATGETAPAIPADTPPAAPPYTM